MQSSTQSSPSVPDPTYCRIASGVGSLTLLPIMACTPPASASEVFCRAAKCNRLMGRVLFAFAIFLTLILVHGSKEFIHNSTAGNVGGAERIVAHLTSFAAQLTLLLSVFFLARRRASAAHHAMVKANNLKASNSSPPPRPTKPPRRTSTPAPPTSSPASRVAASEAKRSFAGVGLGVGVGTAPRAVLFLCPAAAGRLRVGAWLRRALRKGVHDESCPYLRPPCGGR